MNHAMSILSMNRVEIALARLPHSDGLPLPHYQSALAPGSIS